MDALIESVVEWVRGERVPRTRLQVVMEITCLASHCKLWPMAMVSEWNEAVDAACKQGLLVESDGVLRLVTVAATEPEPMEAKQLELF
jgi:hypothetical protein